MQGNYYVQRVPDDISMPEKDDVREDAEKKGEGESTKHAKRPRANEDSMHHHLVMPPPLVNYQG